MAHTLEHMTFYARQSTHSAGHWAVTASCYRATDDTESIHTAPETGLTPNAARISRWQALADALCN